MEDNDKDDLKNKKDFHIAGGHTALDIFRFAVFLTSNLSTPFPTQNSTLNPIFEGEGTKYPLKIQSLFKLNTFNMSLLDPMSRLLQNLQDYFHDYFKTT